MDAHELDIRAALLQIRDSSPSADLAEIALGLSCIAVDRSNGKASICCASCYCADEENYEYFGRGDIVTTEPIPNDFLELAAYEPGAHYLAMIAREGIQQYVDYWFPTAIFRRVR